ncbi:MAG TPA: DNA polymerase I [Spirochaetota bacterium]|nr:DNA polymerase I [Spirochaetota bacterium]
MKKKLYVIDGHALCYRAYYAFIKNPLINSSGQNTSAIFGFARMLLKLIADESPDYIIVAFDPPKKTFRFDIYPEYKANREKMPDDLRSQIDEIKHMVKTLGIYTIEKDNFEADDILGSIAVQFASDETDIMLVTGDKDAYQLVNDKVRIYANKKGISDYEIYDTDAVTQKLGVTPGQVIEYMALTGDTSDNIPGVRGIGEKTAQKLIAEYSSIENLYNNLDKIKGKQKEYLEEYRENALLSRELVTIKTDIPLGLQLDDAAVPELDTEETRTYFEHLEMNSVIRDFFGEPEQKDDAIAAPDREYRIIRDVPALEAAVAEITKAGFVSFDTETTSVNPVEAELVGISFSVRENSGWYIPVIDGTLFSETIIERGTALRIVKPMLENEKIKKIGQNIKYDITVLKKYGITVKGIWFDTMVASYLLGPNDRNHNLDDMASRFLNYKTTTYSELVGKGKNALAITDVPVEDIADYAIEDADITLRLYTLLRKKIQEENLEELFSSIEIPLIEVLSEMEWNGVKIDPLYFEQLAKENQKLLSETEQNIYTLAGAPFNINSTRELATVLFEKLGLKPVKKTKTGFSTDIQVLEQLKGQHEIIDHLIAYRTRNKLKTTYIDTLPRIILSSTGRIHTSYNQTIVATGRLSSSSPNLQNIPVRDDFGRKIRRGFVPEKGCRILAADYSQIELRLAAHLSGDANMIRAFREGIDIHSMTASSVFGVSPDEVTPDMRRQAKIINFATIYKVSPFGLSQQADISVRDAAEFIRKYFETYPGFRDYMDRTIEFAREKGYVQTLLGRKRPVPEIDASAVFRREGAERIAINTPIQGTSADMIKIAMIRISTTIKEEKLASKMIMQVHDELVFEVPENEKEVMEKIVTREMENSLPLDVPVVVDIGWGANWEEAH